MSEHNALYSTQTWLAYRVNETYYGRHYVWCTPFFDPKSEYIAAVPVPPTSSPRYIYKTLQDETGAGDRHSAKVEMNRVGILKGAEHMRQQGVIDGNSYDEIALIAKLAETRDFRPLLLVIPFERVKAAAKLVPVAERAHPLSREYIIPNLIRSQFDVIEFG